MPCAFKRLALCLGLPLLGGCGTVIGNPGVKDDNPDQGETNEFVATVDYDIPDNVSGYELAPSNSDIFRDSSKRVDGVVDRINQMLERLNTDLVNGVGDFTAKGPDGKVSGTIAALTDGGAYDYSAVLCYDKQVFQYVTWSSVSGDVYTVRNHAVDPIDPQRASDMISEVTYKAGDDASIKVFVEVTPPQAIPGADGSKIADLTYSTRSAGNYTLSGIHNWHNEGDVITNQGDEYFLGQFNEAGEGEYLSYNRFRPDCADSFDETNPEWCVAGSLSPLQDYSATEMAEAEERLKDIAIQSKADLVIPVLPADLSCPE